MVVEIKELLQQFEKENREKVEKFFDYAMKQANCSEIDWRSFCVYSESEEYIRKMLEKFESIYLLSIAISVADITKVKNAKNNKVKISIIKNAKSNEDTIDCIREDRTTIIAILNLSRKSRYYLDSEE